MAKKSSVLRQERRQTGGGQVPKEAELTDFEMRFLEEPILTLPLSTPFDSDSTDIEIFQNAVMDINDLKPTPKIARPLKETLAIFRKHAKTPTAPSAAACIEEEHRMKIKYTWRWTRKGKIRSTSCGWSS
ncbi:myb_DNA-bind_5 domain-containing protein [Trichonephila clavipes]|nr:myb_DNA-bind_5 domain-containing protein [Trichonephila clavipes]